MSKKIKSEGGRMTALESILHVLKFMAKRSENIVETRIPVFNDFKAKREEYERYFGQCKGDAFFCCFLEGGIDGGNQAVFISCFKSKEAMKEFQKLCGELEKDWNEAFTAGALVELILEDSSGAEADNNGM